MKEKRSIFAKVWDKAEAALDGKPTVTKYLYSYPSEDYDKYAYRLKNSSYQNLPNAILLRWSQIFVKSKIAVTTTDSTIQLIADNIDNKGGNTETLAKDIFEDIAVYGSAWLLVDLPEWFDKPDNASEADRLADGILPYVSVYSQPNVMDWHFNRYGHLDYVVVKTTDVRELEGVTHTVYAEYGIGYKQEFILKSSDGPLSRINIGPPVAIEVNGIPYMPMIVGGLQRYRSNPDYFNSPMNSIVDTALELYNRSSANGAAYDKVGFAFLAIGENSNIDQLGFSSLVKVAAGEMVPEYIQPDATCFEQYRLEIQRLIDTIFSLAGMKNRAVTSDAAMSGTALLLEDATSYNMVQLIAAATEDLLKRTWSLLKIANNSPNANLNMQFPDSYDFDSLQTEMENLKTATTLNNDALYMALFTNFIKRKIADPAEQERIIKEEAAKTRLNINMTDPSTLELYVRDGIISIIDLVKTIVPATINMSDDEILTFIKENKDREFTTVDNN